MQGVPQPWKPLLQECAGLAMRQILKEPSDPAGWKLFMLIPRMILCHLRGGSCGLKQTCSNFKAFLDFRWEQLLSCGSTSSSRDFCSSDASNQHRATLRLVGCGEISRAGKLLVSQGLAPVSAEVADN